MPRKARFYHTKNEYRKKQKHDDSSCVDSSTPTADPDGTPALLVSLPVDYFYKSPATTLTQLKDKLSVHLNHEDWKLHYESGHNITPFLILFKVKINQDTSGCVQVHLSLKIAEDFTWKLFVCGQLASLDGLKTTLSSVSDVQELLSVVDASQMCIGNPEAKYEPLVSKHKGVFMDAQGTKKQAQYDTSIVSSGTIRSTECTVVLNSDSTSKHRCGPCTVFRKTLSGMLSRTQKDSAKSDPSSHTNYRYLDTPEKVSRLKKLHTSVRLEQQRSTRLRATLSQIIEEKGVEVDQSLHEDLVEVVQETSPFVAENYPPDSFQRIFWEQQAKATSLKDSRSMKWHSLMIRWALYLRHLSGSAYEVLRESGVIKLPSQRTLRDYTYYTTAASGFSADVDLQLMDVADIQSCSEVDKHVIILMDEMHIKEDIVYDKHSGAIVGFINLGDINSHLEKFARNVDQSKVENDQPANSMLVLMVRGLFSKLSFPYAQFPCSSVTGDQMFQPFWEAVSRLERCGFKVLALTCDGLSANRRLFKMHSTASSSGPTYKVLNPFASEERYIYFISDPPHLMKTVRNAWASNKRLLWHNGKYITWSHLTELYHKNRSYSETPGLALVPKLKYEHISLSSFSKMRVDLAVQVLSGQVSSALKLTGGEEVEETVNFTEVFDKFFDCVNVSSFSAGKLQRSAFKSPYRSASDFRLTWLNDTFLGYLENWEKSVEARPGDFTPDQRNRMMLSSETRLGLKITVKSFIEMTKYIFEKIPGVSIFLSGRISQDPLEKFFGQQRQRGRSSDNPNVSEFLKNTQALRVIDGVCRNVRGNCRGDKGKENQCDSEYINKELPKRKKSRASRKQ